MVAHQQAAECLHATAQYAPPGVGPAFRGSLQIGAGGGRGLLLRDAARLHPPQPGARGSGAAAHEAERREIWRLAPGPRPALARLRATVTPRISRAARLRP